MKKLLLKVVPVLLMLGTVLVLNAQVSNIISGTVKDSKKGEPIGGAAVQVKGTTLGTITDPDGKFTLAVPATAKTLTVKSIGYKATDVDIAKGDFNVSLPEDILGLEQVVVTALGIKKEKRALPYSVQEVTGDDINRAANGNVINGIEGKVAGAQVISSSGSPGSAVYVKLRGATSLTQDNQPLFVIDGIPVSNDMVESGNPDNTTNINLTQGVNYSNRGLDINPDDIDNVTVLKGPAATALYGISASNGALVITTKRGGKIGGSKKINAEFSTGITFDQVNKLPELQNKFSQGSGGSYLGPGTHASGSWGALVDTLYWNNANDYKYDQHGMIVGASDTGARTKVTPYDNVKQFFRTGVTYNNSIALSGANDWAGFRLSFSDMRQNGVVPLSNYARTSVRLNSDFKISNKVSASASANYVKSGGDRVQQGSNISGLMLDLLRTPITFDNSNGSKNPKDTAAYIFGDGTQRNYRGNRGYDNPYWTINQNPFHDDVNRFVGSGQVNYNPVGWLSFMYRIGTDMYSDRRKQFFDVNSRAFPNGQIFEDHNFNRSTTSDIIVTAAGSLVKDKLNGSLTVGNNLYQQNFQHLFTQGDGLAIPGFQNLSNAVGIISRETHSEYRTAAVYFDGKLEFKNMLFLDVTGRNEWTSTLLKPHNHFFYPSVSAGFIFTEPLKLSQNKWFPYGKIRLSFAQVGKDAPLYATKTYYSQTVTADGWTPGVSFPFNGLVGYQNGPILGFPNLKAEKTNSYEGGLDFRFFENRLGIDFTYYYTKSTDLILSAPVAPSSGYTNAAQNSGTIQNQGMEFVINATPVKAGDFRWDIQWNISRNRNKVLALANGVPTLFLGGFQGSDVRAVVGQPFGVIYGNDFYKDKNGNYIIDVSGSPNAGDANYNANYGYPIANPQSEVIGNPNPKWLTGFTNTFSYKGLSLSIMFDVKVGGDVWNGTRGALTFFGRTKDSENRGDSTVFTGVLAQVDGSGNLMSDSAGNPLATTTKNGTKAVLDQSWYQGNGGGFGSVSKTFVEDGTFVRLRELVISYTLDRKILKKGIIKSITLAFIGRNLALWTHYKGIDPETNLQGSNNAQGLDYFNMPNTRSLGFSIKVGL